MQRVFYTDLEDVEGLKLDVSALVSEQVHHQLQVLGSADVLCHDSEVVSVQEQFSEQLENSKNKQTKNKQV